MFAGSVLLICLFTASALVALADTYTFTTIDDPAALPGITYALGLNNAGQIVGYYSDATGYHGFLYSGGVFAPINAPSAPNSTVAIGINNAGQIVGYFTDGTGQHGFLYNGGTFTTIDFPSSVSSSANGINDAGQIVGLYFDGSVDHGFLYNGGTFTTIDDPSAGQVTDALGINNAGQITGYWENGPGATGFLYSAGTFTNISVPGAATSAIGINNAGLIVGEFDNATGTHGFLDNGGTLTTIDHPLAAGYTVAWGINDSGQISGNYTDANRAQHGFLATPTNPYVAAIQQPINSDGSSVFNAKRGVVPVKFTLALNGTTTCQLPPATIALTRTSGSVPGPIDESVFLLASDNGSNFRIDSCQYVYNLATGSLGPGSYVVQIKINGNAVGNGTFGLR